MIFNELIGNLEFQIKFDLSFFAIKSQSLIMCFSLGLIKAGAVIPSKL